MPVSDMSSLDIRNLLQAAAAQPTLKRPPAIQAQLNDAGIKRAAKAAKRAKRTKAAASKRASPASGNQRHVKARKVRSVFVSVSSASLAAWTCTYKTSVAVHQHAAICTSLCNAKQAISVRVHVAFIRTLRVQMGAGGTPPRSSRVTRAMRSAQGSQAQTE